MSAAATPPPGAPGDVPSGRPPSDDDRRNHYRVLHVQPEAPLPVIKASYRALMSSLRMHPDLGGNPAEATAINLAWAVLSDPVRRAAYDRWLRRQGHLAPRAPAGSSTQASTRAPAPTSNPASAAKASAAKASAAKESAPAASAAASRASAGRAQPAPGPAPTSPAAPAAAHPVPPSCPLCAQACGPVHRPDERCLRCHAPLAPLPLPGSPGHELLGRRNAARRSKAHVAMLHIGWPSPALPVRWRDLSLTGLSFFAPQALAPGQRVWLQDQAMEAVAEVVTSRPQGRLFTVHARVVSALLLQPTGVFVSTQA